MADTTAPRCEPPAHLRDKNGWHWVLGEHANAELFPDYWFAPTDSHKGFWDNAGEPDSTTYNYDSPAYSPSDVARLIEAARDAVQRLNESGTGVVGLIDTIHAAAAILRPALSPFTDASEADHG